MTDDGLRRAYWSAAYHDEWYSGNNPGRQARLAKIARELADQMRERGLSTDEIDRRVRGGEMPG